MSRLHNSQLGAILYLVFNKKVQVSFIYLEISFQVMREIISINMDCQKYIMSGPTHPLTFTHAHTYTKNVQHSSKLR